MRRVSVNPNKFRNKGNNQNNLESVIKILNELKIQKVLNPIDRVKPTMRSKFLLERSRMGDRHNRIKQALRSNIREPKTYRHLGRNLSFSIKTPKNHKISERNRKTERSNTLVRKKPGRLPKRAAPRTRRRIAHTTRRRRRKPKALRRNLKPANASNKQNTG
jgi:hypothetical protein